MKIEVYTTSSHAYAYSGSRTRIRYYSVVVNNRLELRTSDRKLARNTIERLKRDYTIVEKEK